ncbi:MAG: hypothetical protein BGO28_05330 [Alphaproteobacteria bacterium 43-37]|nr:MAG: hypothetical protein BGO28_05330 [Alphaproteobacteria bacterium 43-37]
MSMAGNFLEFYDFALYGILVPIMSPLFFPSKEAWFSEIMGLVVFTMGFIARPLGAAMFGMIGDRYGRKQSLRWSVVLMAVATMGIGILPTYEMIGIAAPALLIVLRILQGISAGGESNGSVIFVMEHFPPNQRGLGSSLMSSATISGVILATFVSSLLTADEGHHQHWRWAFIAGSAIGIVSYYIRKHLNESPQFLQIVRANNISKNPLKETFRKAPMAVLQTFCLSAVAGALQLSLAGYFSIYLKDHLNMPFSQIIFLNAICLLIYAFILPITGLLVDRVNPLKLLLGSSLAAVVCLIPIYQLAAVGTVAAIIAAQLWLAVITALYVGPKSVVMYNLFETKIRFTGVSFGYASGVSVFGGLTPIINKSLDHVGFSPALFAVACGVITSVTILFLWRNPPKNIPHEGF